MASDLTVAPVSDAPAPEPADAPRPRLRVLPGRRHGTARPALLRLLMHRGISPYLVLADLLGVAVAALAAGGLTGGLLVVGAGLIWLDTSGGLYRSRLSLSILEQAPQVAVRALAAFGIAAGLGVLVGAGEAVRPLFGATVALLAVAVVLRAAVLAGVRRLRRRGVVAHPTLVLGAGRVGRHITETLLEHTEYGLRPVGFLDADPLLGDGERPAPLLGGTDRLAETITAYGARHVVIAFSSQPSSAMVDIIRTCDRLECELFIVPRLFELHDRSGHDVEVVWGLPLLRMREAPFHRLSWRVKRLLDVAVSATLLLLLSPVLAACALAARAETGRVLFRQTRVGVDSRAFELLKFCSMRPLDGEAETLWSIADDDRVGPLGRLLRMTSLDELPQLWNVLRGDMSLVGPRPERPHFVDQFALTFPRYMARHRVPSGMTGWAQVHGLRGDTSIADRARFDNYYIENWSLWLDLQILLRTAWVIVAGQGR